MALKAWTMSFKEKNQDEIKLHEILAKKTSPMAFAKDILIDVLVRGNYSSEGSNNIKNDYKSTETKSEIENIFDI